MKLSAPWHRKAEPSPAVPRVLSSLDAISAQLEGLSRTVERLDRARPAATTAQEQANEGLETAISGLRTIVSHVQSADALADLGSDVRAISDTAMREQAPAAPVANAIDNLERRLDSITDAIAAFRAENRRRTMRNLESLVDILNEKIETLQVQQAGETRPLATSPAQAERPIPGVTPAGLTAIERGIADLMSEVKDVRAHTMQLASGQHQKPSCPAEKDLAELRQTHSIATRRAQDSFAAVHGTIDDLFSRMASLESDIRARDTKRAAAPADPAQGSEWRASAPPPEAALTPDAAPMAASVPEDAPGFAKLREPGRPYRPAVTTGVWSAPIGGTAARHSRRAGTLVKALVGIALTAGLVGGALLLAPSLASRPALDNPPAKTVSQAKSPERGPRLDQATRRPGALAQAAESLLAEVPSIGPSLIRSAATGDPGAAYEIGIRLTESSANAGGAEQAVVWLERAANAGVVPALLALGSIYEKGRGVARDAHRSRSYYLAAAEKGNAKAMHNLAVLCAHGVGGRVDQVAAADWFRKAAAHGLVDSQFNLAVLYERGSGVAQNVGEAYKWYGVAARQGDFGAARKRDELAKQLDARRIQTMNAAIEAFVAEPQPDESVTVKLPPGGWERAPDEAEPKPRRSRDMGRGIASLQFDSSRGW